MRVPELSECTCCHVVDVGALKGIDYLSGRLALVLVSTSCSFSCSQGFIYLAIVLILSWSLSLFFLSFFFFLLFSLAILPLPSYLISYRFALFYLLLCIYPSPHVPSKMILMEQLFVVYINGERRVVVRTDAVCRYAHLIS